jgi:hypothetical protein
VARGERQSVIRRASISGCRTLEGVPDHVDKPDTLDPEVIERLITRDIEEQKGQRLSRRTLETQRSLESYMKAGIRPRWSERLMEIERETRFHLRALEKRLNRLREESPADLPARWRVVAETWDFRRVNDLIDQHNQWFPIERDLPMNPRTGEYLPIMGRDYRRTPFGPDWVLEQFPV